MYANYDVIRIPPMTSQRFLLNTVDRAVYDRLHCAAGRYSGTSFSKPGYHKDQDIQD